MTTLCLVTDLTSSELAAWVQAVGSIAAILGSVGIAIWQASKQHKSALAVHSAEQRSAREEVSKTLSVLATNCLKAMDYLNREINSSEAVYDIAEGGKYFDIFQLERLDQAIANIPLHSLPSPLVTPAMLLGATIRQHRNKVEQVLRVHRTMNANDFADFFKTLEEMKASLALTCNDINKEVSRASGQHE
ncbi:MAG TPA: hypothetical protein PLW81_04320 [Thiobacillaceae bacterium]|nr:hypothetical protein [Thiobacillaceae bacterium]